MFDAKRGAGGESRRCFDNSRVKQGRECLMRRQGGRGGRADDDLRVTWIKQGKRMFDAADKCIRSSTNAAKQNTLGTKNDDVRYACQVAGPVVDAIKPAHGENQNEKKRRNGANKTRCCKMNVPMECSMHTATTNIRFEGLRGRGRSPT